MRASADRTLALAALTIGVIALAVILITTGGSGYTLHALFQDSGQLVRDGEVQIAGRSVGSITDLSLTPNGLADITMSIDDGDVTPLHQGTRAIIRALGQAGVANRFIQLIPGPQSAPTLKSGATLSTSQTTGIVDLDEVLDIFDPATRASLQQLIAHSSQIFAGTGSTYFNRMLLQLDPALSQLNAVTSQLSADHAELSDLVDLGATAAHAVATRSADLQQAVASSAQALAAIATERAQLADLLQRAPGVLHQAATTLTDTATAVTALTPALKDVVPVATPLKRVLELVPPTLHQASPVIAGLTSELHPLTQTLRGLAPLIKPAVTALTKATAALKVTMPILTGAREYGSDLILGIFDGLGGIVSGPYAAIGHYGKLEFVQSPQTISQGPLSSLLTAQALVPGVLQERTHLIARCPGGDAPPAPDGSNPWIPDKTLCDPADDVPLSVDFP